jgi:TRAP-type mannitol/chloroaromatic compound transport system substrate-binding protein
MKRRQFLTTAGTSAAVAAITKPAIAQSMPTIKWRLTASWPKSLDTIFGACETMADPKISPGGLPSGEATFRSVWT